MVNPVNAADLSVVRDAVVEMIRNLPDEVDVRAFDYDPDSVRDLDISTAVLVERAGLSKPDGAVTVYLDDRGAGYLIATGSDFLLCNVNDDTVRSCFLIPVHGHEGMECEDTVFEQRETGLTNRLLICNRVSLTGTGLYAEGKLYFLANRDLEYLGYLPTREYISGWGFAGAATLDTRTDRSKLVTSGVLQRCVTIEFTTGEDTGDDASREVCEGYRIDPVAKRIVHESGRNALAANLIDVYRQNIEELIALTDQK